MKVIGDFIEDDLGRKIAMFFEGFHGRIEVTEALEFYAAYGSKQEILYDFEGFVKDAVDKAFDAEEMANNIVEHIIADFDA